MKQQRPLHTPHDSAASSSVSIGLAAKYLGVSVDTLRRWERLGKLQAQRLDGKNRYFLFSDLEQFKELQPYSTAKVAGLLGLSQSSVRRLEQLGSLKPTRDENNKRLYDPMQVSEYVTGREKARSIPISPALPPTSSAEAVNLTTGNSLRISTDSLANNQTLKPSQVLPEPVFHNRGRERKSLGLLLLSGWLFAAFLLLISGPWHNGLTQGPVSKTSSLLTADGSSVINGELNKSAALSLPSTFFVDASNSWLSIDNTTQNLTTMVAVTGNFATKPVTTNQIADQAVGTQQLADGGVTLADLSPDLQTLISSSQNTGPNITNLYPTYQTTNMTSVLAGIGLRGSSTNNVLTLGINTGSTTTVVNNNLEVQLSGGLVTTTLSSGSGLEATNSGLQLLGGCATAQVLEWTGTAWACSTIVTGSSNLALKEGGTTITTNPTAINFTGSDFNVADVGGQNNISIDYTNSGITQVAANEAVVGNWSFKDSGFTLKDDVDNTKQANFQLSGIASGTTQTFNLPNASGTIVTTGNLANITTVGTVGSGTWQGSPVGVQYGGTGAVSFTTGGVLYGNGTGTVQASAAGTSGQLLVASGGALPTFVTLSADATLSPLGALTLASTGTSTGTFGDGTHVAQVTVDAKGRITGVTNTLISGAAPTGAAGGDLTGNFPGPTIGKLQGNTLTIASLSPGQILQYNGSAFVNQTLSGDITLSSSGVATIGANKVTNGDLANSSLTVTAGTGLSGGGAVALGSSTTLNVAYGSAASTAVQGNIQLTVTAGTGLSGGRAQRRSARAAR